MKTYPDGMPLVPWEDGGMYNLVRTTSLPALMEYLFYIDARKARGCPVGTLLLPFFPGARQDRLNDTGDYLFTAKSVAMEINLRGFDEVVVVDPHSDVVPALVDRCRVVSIVDFIEVPTGKYTAIVAPDAGAEKRAGAVARKLKLPLLHAWKYRNVNTGAITGFGMESPDVDVDPDGTLLVVDDICDGGGTFLGLAGVLDAMRLKAHLFTTHGLYTQGTEKLVKAFNGHVYCTDSTTNPKPGVFVIPVCERL